MYLLSIATFQLYFITSRHERYLGMWLDDLRCGPGVIVNSIGTYLEAIFANGGIAVSYLL